MFHFDNLIEPGSRDDRLLQQIDPKRLPAHIAIIMDGNGRWAARRNKTRTAGHRAGAESVRDSVETTARLGIPFITLYAFSVENWKRPKREVDTLMALLKEFLRKEQSVLRKNNIQFRTIGRIDQLASSVQREITRGKEATRECTGTVMTLALNYGGRSEIVDAVREIAGEVQRGDLRAGQIDESLVSQHLYTRDMPDPDLVIRTSGEFRISNFLLWQIAYSEMYVTDALWPDFRRPDLLEAIIAYQKRDRRFGGLSVCNTKPAAARQRTAEIALRKKAAQK